jgi:hypothetical protein
VTETAEKENTVALLQHNLVKAQLRMKKYTDAKRTKRIFELGDMVYLKMKSYRETTLGMQNPPKLSPRWYGPLKVLKKVGQVSYQL